jgi:hypothetical protein
MTRGDPVEVNIIWAAAGPLKPPLRHWFKGYTFERHDGRTVMVKDKDGSIVRYAAVDVRPAS